MNQTTSTSTSHNLETDVKRRTLALIYETPILQKNLLKPPTEDQEITVSRKKVIFTKKEGTSKTVHNVYKKTPWGKENIPPASTSTMSSICSVRTVKKADGESCPIKVTKKSQASAETAASSATDKKRGYHQQNNDEYPLKYGKRKIEYLDIDDDETDEEEESKKDSKENKSNNSQERMAKQVRRSDVPVVAPTVSYIYLKTKKERLIEFPVFLEKELKYSKSLSEVLRETELDNDCETDNEILEHSILQAKKDLVKGIEMQKTENQVKKTALKEKPTICIPEDQPTNEKQKENNSKKDTEASNGFWTKVSQSFNTLFSP